MKRPLCNILGKVGIFSKKWFTTCYVKVSLYFLKPKMKIEVLTSTTSKHGRSLGQLGFVRRLRRQWRNHLLGPRQSERPAQIEIQFRVSGDCALIHESSYRAMGERSWTRIGICRFSERILLDDPSRRGRQLGPLSWSSVRHRRLT